jgi:hypothetical protein
MTGGNWVALLPTSARDAGKEALTLKFHHSLGQRMVTGTVADMMLSDIFFWIDNLERI